MFIIILILIQNSQLIILQLIILALEILIMSIHFLSFDHLLTAKKKKILLLIKEELNYQVHFCPNNNGTNPILHYYEFDGYENTIELEDSRTYIMYSSWADNIYKFNFTSNNEFVFGFIFDDKYDQIAEKDTEWYRGRKVLEN